MSKSSYSPEASSDPAGNSCSSCAVKYEPIYQSNDFVILDNDDSLQELCSRCKFLKEVGKECVKNGIITGKQISWGNSEARWSALSCSDGELEIAEAEYFEVFTLPGLSAPTPPPPLGLGYQTGGVLALQLGSPKPFPEFPEVLLLGNTNSVQTLAQVQGWLDVCQNSHKICTTQVLETSKLPKSLLDVSMPTVRLCEPYKSGFETYICLSHCWGGVEPLCKTTLRTIESNKCGIDWEMMPATFQDAVDFTRRLGVRYLWIDSMCII